MLNPDQIKAEIAQLRLLIADNDDPQLWLDMLEGQGFNEVMEGLLSQRQETLALMTGIKARVAELKTKFDRHDATVERIEKAMFVLLKLARLNAPLRLPEATLSIGAGREKAIIDDLNLIPEEYVDVEVSARKAEILAALKRGETVPGAHKERGDDSLSIRTK